MPFLVPLNVKKNKITGGSEMKRGRPKAAVKKVTISTTVDPTVAKKLSNLAQKNHRSISGQLSKILEDWIVKVTSE